MRILSIGFGDKKKVKYEKANNAGITETYQAQRMILDQRY